MKSFESVQQSSSEESEISYEKVDRKSPEILSALATAPVFRKQGEVSARPASAGEMIETYLTSGIKETTNSANVGDWIVTNPFGEQYLVPEKRFLSSYEPTAAEGVFNPKGFCRAIKNPFAKPIEIMASWGSPQVGDENCMIADTCDVSGENMGGEPYLIDGDAFAETYKQSF